MEATWDGAVEALSVESREVVLRRLRNYALLMDASVKIPYTGISFGIESALGLVPVVGDAAGAILAAYVPLEAIRTGAPWWLIFKMVLNILVDALVGTVPILGDLFDILWKPSVRNVRMLERYLTS